MSLFSALDTAVSGLTAQSAAFSNISDNVANSQSTGYKAVDTSFVDYLTTSTPTTNEPGSVVALPDYTNTVQGTVSQSSDPLALAISGQGFFAVSQPTGVSSGTGTTTFNPQTYYTRAGDFALNKDGYLVNSEGDYLQGWSVDAATGAVNQSSVAPIQIGNTQFNPIPTSTVSLSANLPTSGGSGPFTSQVDVYDTLGNQHSLTLSWTPSATTANSWTLNVYPDASTTPAATATVDFGTNGVAAGTIGDMSTTTAGATAATFTNGAPATLSFDADFGSGNQPIALSLGNFGQGTGVTQFASSTYALGNLSQNGVPPGSFTGLTMTDTGDVVANFNNGQSQTVAQVPVVTFANADALQRQDAQAFTDTSQAGPAITQAQNTSGAGSLVTSSVEDSNVDIATEFSKLIVAQEAYSANAKLITSADQMLQVTIDMKT